MISNHNLTTSLQYLILSIATAQTRIEPRLATHPPEFQMSVIHSLPTVGCFVPPRYGRHQVDSVNFNFNIDLLDGNWSWRQTTVQTEFNEQN